MNTYIFRALQNAPVLFTEHKQIADAWDLAIHTLLAISTVDCSPKMYNRTGLWTAEPGLMIRAGGGYPTPWTRDAAVNTMNAACFLEPEAAKNTLWAVCEKVDGKLCFQMDDQSWDKIVWATGAWEYYLASGDIAFLKDAYETVKNSLLILEKTQYNANFGLFTGGSFFNDGITGYPAVLHQKGNESSFVGDHPDVASIMTLSTNCLYCNAYRILAKMVRILNEKTGVKGVETSDEKMEWKALEAWYSDRAKALRSAINKWLWNEQKGSYGYFIYPNGTRDESQEGCGLSFAVLFGICDCEKAGRILGNMQISGRGLVSVWPPFEGISSIEKPLRHNNLIWPFVNGFFADAAAKCGRSDLLGDELFNVANLAVESGGFYEIYDPETGQPDGGWQCGGHWESVADQTWSATGFIRMIVYGVFGMIMQENGVRFAPCMPDGLGRVSLKGLRIRGLELDLVLDRKDESAARILIDGEAGEKVLYSEAGRHCIEMWV